MSDKKYEDKPGSGILFTNKYKSSDKHPDWQGKVLDLDGKELAISGWTKTGKSGNTFISIALSPPWDGKKKSDKSDSKFEPKQPGPSMASYGLDDDDDDLPF